MTLMLVIIGVLLLVVRSFALTNVVSVGLAKSTMWLLPTVCQFTASLLTWYTIVVVLSAMVSSALISTRETGLDSIGFRYNQ